MMEWEIKLKKSIAALKKDIKREYDGIIKEMRKEDDEICYQKSESAREAGSIAGVRASFAVFKEMLNMSNYERESLFEETDVLAILNHNDAIDLFKKTKTYMEKTTKGAGFEYLRELRKTRKQIKDIVYSRLELAKSKEQQTKGGGEKA